MRSRRGLPTRNRPRFPRSTAPTTAMAKRFVGEPCCKPFRIGRNEPTRSKQGCSLVTDLMHQRRRNTSADHTFTRHSDDGNRVLAATRQPRTRHAESRRQCRDRGSKSPAALCNSQAVRAHRRRRHRDRLSHTPVSLSLRCVITSENRSSLGQHNVESQTQHCEPTLRLFRRRRIA